MNAILSRPRTGSNLIPATDMREQARQDAPTGVAVPDQPAGTQTAAPAPMTNPAPVLPDAAGYGAEPTATSSPPSASQTLSPTAARSRLAAAIGDLQGVIPNYTFSPFHPMGSDAFNPQLAPAKRAVAQALAAAVAAGAVSDDTVAQLSALLAQDDDNSGYDAIRNALYAQHSGPSTTPVIDGARQKLFDDFSHALDERDNTGSSQFVVPSVVDAGTELNADLQSDKAEGHISGDVADQLRGLLDADVDAVTKRQQAIALLGLA